MSVQSRIRASLRYPTPRIRLPASAKGTMPVRIAFPTALDPSVSPSAMRTRSAGMSASSTGALGTILKTSPPWSQM